MYGFTQSPNLATPSFRILGDVTLAWCVGAIIMVLVIVLTIVGNLAVMVALKQASPRLPGHYPLASLATADLMLGVFVLPIAAARELFLFQPDQIVCACWNTLDVLCCTASILSICALGWERCSGITAPLARARRSSRARLFSLLVWPVAAMVALPTALIPSPKHYHPGDVVKACSVNTNIGYVFYSITFSFYLPASGMMFLYTKILMALSLPVNLRAHRGRQPAGHEQELHKSNKVLCGCITKIEIKKAQCKNDIPRTPIAEKCSSKIRANFRTPEGNHLAARDVSSNSTLPSPLKSSYSPGGIIPRQRRATKIIIMLMSLFLLCWTPFFVMLPIDSLCECMSDTTWLVCSWLGYINSTLNPAVYAAASPTVREALSKSFSSISSKTDAITPVIAKTSR